MCFILPRAPSRSVAHDAVETRLIVGLGLRRRRMFRHWWRSVTCHRGELPIPCPSLEAMRSTRSRTIAASSAALPVRPVYTAPEAPASGRRLLLLTYHFPPSQAAGALRWQRMLPYAASRGWAADVIAADPSAITPADPRRLEELPPGTRVFAAAGGTHWSANASAALRKALSVVRPGRGTVASEVPSVANAPASPDLAIPRDEVRWLPVTVRGLKRHVGAFLNHANEAVWASSAEQVARTLGASVDYDAIITCGPPHAVHAAGARLSRALGIPLVMDLRDPWSCIRDLEASIASPLWYRIAERRERAAVNQAALVVMNTDPARVAMQAAHRHAAIRIITARNGCDDEFIPASRHGRKFTIAYAGSIYLSRDPRPFLRASARVVNAMALTPDDFGIAVLGQVAGAPLREIAVECGIADYVTLEAPRPRREALEFLAEAAMLLNLPQSAAQCIPSKLFEYVQFNAWLLALEPEGTATEMMLRDSGADIVPPDDEEAIAAIIRCRYEEYARGIRPTPIGSDGRFHRRHQATRLLDELDARLGRAKDGSTSASPALATPAQRPMAGTR